MILNVLDKNHSTMYKPRTDPQSCSLNPGPMTQIYDFTIITNIEQVMFTCVRQYISPLCI